MNGTVTLYCEPHEDHTWTELCQYVDYTLMHGYHVIDYDTCFVLNVCDWILRLQWTEWKGLYKLCVYCIAGDPIFYCFYNMQTCTGTVL